MIPSMVVRIPSVREEAEHPMVVRILSVREEMVIKMLPEQSIWHTRLAQEAEATRGRGSKLKPAHVRMRRQMSGKLRPLPPTVHMPHETSREVLLRLLQKLHLKKVWALERPKNNGLSDERQVKNEKCGHPQAVHPLIQKALLCPHDRAMLQIPFLALLQGPPVQVPTTRLHILPLPPIPRSHLTPELAAKVPRRMPIVRRQRQTSVLQRL